MNFFFFQKNIKNEILHYVQDDKRRVARQDKKRSLGRTKRGCSAGQMGSKGIATLRVASARQQKMSFSNAE
jgi:hypothetical protein